MVFKHSFQWRDTGFGAYSRAGPTAYNPDCGVQFPGFWRPAYGGYPVSGPSSVLSRHAGSHSNLAGFF